MNGETVWSRNMKGLLRVQSVEIKIIQTKQTKAVGRSKEYWIRGLGDLGQRSADYGLQANFSPLLVFVSKALLKHSDLHFCLHIIYVCFCASRAETSGYDWDLMTHKVKNTYWLGLYRKSLRPLLPLIKQGTQGEGTCFRRKETSSNLDTKEPK